jgi:hypothetical protein
MECLRRRSRARRFHHQSPLGIDQELGPLVLPGNTRSERHRPAIAPPSATVLRGPRESTLAALVAVMHDIGRFPRGDSHCRARRAPGAFAGPRPSPSRRCVGTRHRARRPGTVSLPRLARR